MLRRVLLSIALGSVVASGVHAQGIRGVTRRTSTLEFQAPARQFFDAAGINITGGGTAATAPGAGVASPSAAGVARPTAMPLLSTRGPSSRLPARPYVLGPAPALANTTNGSQIASTLPDRPQSRSPLPAGPVSARVPAAPARTPAKPMALGASPIAPSSSR